MRVDLGEDRDGGKRWAELTDLNDVPRRVKYRVQEDVLTLYEKAEMHPALINMRVKDLLIANLVTEWSPEFGAPPNKDIERVMDLPNSVYEALVEAIKPYEEDLDFMKAGKAAQEAAKAEQSSEPAATTGSRDGSADTSSQDTSPTRA